MPELTEFEDMKRMIKAFGDRKRVREAVANAASPSGPARRQRARRA